MFFRLRLWWGLVLIAAVGTEARQGSADYKVFCTAKEMTVTVKLTDSKTQVYVDRLKGYPGCLPEISDGRAVFHMSLEDIYTCGTTKMTDSHGRKVFYNRVVLEYSKTKRDRLLVKCEIHGRNLSLLRNRRDVLPEGFIEPDEVNITDTVIGHAVLPEIYVGVRQNGNFIDTQVNVQPGTPLEMEVFLDQNSSDTYGLLVNYMNVTDKSPGQREIIIYQGCSIDPYLFSNFESDNGNRLTARFRAFKFPESSYVLFIGSVNICIQSCKGIPCSNGQVGFGRRKRELASSGETNRDPNKVFEVVMTTILKVDPDKEQPLKEASLAGTADATEVVPNEKTSEEVVNSPNIIIQESNGGRLLDSSVYALFLTILMSFLHQMQE